MIWLLLVVSALALLFYWKFVKPMSYWKDRGVIQYKPLPLFGNLFEFIIRRKSWPELIQEFYNIAPNARYCGVYQINVPTLIIRDLDLIKQLTIKDFDHFTNHGDFIDPESDKLWGRNLFSLKGQAWKDMRSIVSPTFTSSKMKLMYNLMDNVAKNLVEYLKEKNETVIELSIKDLYSRYANDVIATTALGVTVDSLRNKDNEFYVVGKELTNFNFTLTLKIIFNIMFNTISKLIKMKIFGKKYFTFFNNIIEQNIKEREANGIVRPDMIHIMMEARKGRHIADSEVVVDTGFATAQESPGIAKLPKSKVEVTIDDMISQAMIFYFAGFDNSSHLMCFISYELALNPEIQNRLRKEILDTLETHSGKITYEILLGLKYLDMVVSEALRKWPIGVVLDRICSKPYTIEPKLPGEVPVHMKPGEVFFVSIMGLHYDPNYYPNPQKFDPERFSEENIHNIKTGAYIPFGIGPRNCIGSRFAILETKLVIFHILAHFELVPVEKTQVPFKMSTKSFNLAEDTGFWLGLKPLVKAS